ncbi:SulP family inorganic anion transporter [Flammeovirga sp. EKP202]|uniref:SulP family inorganic anion transporter n=1 Tax=Flammeovirga sp. EKP202 TaxID=2770592 RepID=UPI00165F9CBA|nr:solute carrier family 23 protein [Flammeovirga sp. EKP202]MBD0401324.1 SulP family inorganic anion transporter [Flammeovirga sp. EKP202]
MNKSNLFNNYKKDFPASIVVFLVALPLCLGIALASGAPLLSGVIAGIIGGIVVASFSGSAVGVSGPAAGLAVIVFHSIQDLGSFEAFLCTVVLAGVIQILLGVFKAGVIGYYFPNAVIKGMLTGIGINILFQQLPNALGYVGPDHELTLSLSNITTGAVIVTAVSLLILIGWEKPFIQKNKILKIIPGPLATVLFGILFYVGTEGHPTFGILESQLVALPVIHNMDEFLGTFRFPDFSAWNNPHVYTIAFTMAIVASLETLLSVEAADKMDPQKRHTPTNRELIAQGTGNIISGLIGGLPITQVIVRSSVNVQSGGQSKLSAIFHGVLLFICVLTIPVLLDLIPLACLAAILLTVGYKLAKPQNFISMYNKGIQQFLPFIVTALGVVFTDLLEGIALGLIVSVVEIVWETMKDVVDVKQDNQQQSAEGPIHIELANQVSFLNKAQVKKALDNVPENSQVVIDASKSKTLHSDVKEIIEDFMQGEAEQKNIQAELILAK